jgi:hypothetical protein
MVNHLIFYLLLNFYPTYTLGPEIGGNMGKRHVKKSLYILAMIE